MNIPLPVLIPWLTLVKVIVPVVVALIVNHAIDKFFRVPKNLTSPRASTYVSVFKSFLRVIVFAISGYIVFTVLAINMTPLFASAGVVGIILGLGIRTFIEDFFTGMFILTEDTIRVGDYVDIGGSEGVTESLGLRTVRLRDRNGAVHIFPNREIKRIINFSKRQARVIVDMPIKSNQSVDKVFEALTRALAAIRKDPAVGDFIQENSRLEGVDSISNGVMIVRVLLITRPSERWNVGRTFRRIALKELERAGVLLA
jgi:small conductance mechanosensitive channel